MTTWVLVTDTASSRLFSTELPEDAWTLVKEFQHPESREPARESRTTAPYGRTRQTAGDGSVQSAFEPHTSPADNEHGHFAAELAVFLEKARLEDKFDQLVLVAAPHFLGQLKSKLPAQTLKRLKTTIDKDLTQLKPAELRERLVALLFPRQVGAT